MRTSALSHFFLAWYLCVSAVQGAVEYYGKFIGPLKTFHHGVTGDVYAVDARTLHIREFNYDGEGPAAYFYVGTTKVVNGNGHKMLDEKGSPNPLKRYRRRHITLTLPEGKTLANVKWFSVYCDEAAVNFADVKIPKGMDFPKPQKIGALNGVHAVTSEPIVIVDAQTLLIPSFSYDGEAPDAKFWVGRGPKPSPQGIRVPDENGKEVPLRRYDRKTIVLTLPGDLTVFEIGHFGVWCEAFTVDFGHIQIPQGLNVPPSLKMLGVSPQKRSRSLQLSALPQQQLQQGPNNNKQRNSNRDKNYNSNFNYQNVLPLFNVQETVRPTTYRPQLLIQPTTVELGSLENVDHRFSQKQTNGYLPLGNFGQPFYQQNQFQHQQNQFQQQQNTQLHHRFPTTPSVQIIPSVSLNDDNGLIVPGRFDLGPPLLQQFPLDPNFYNQQLQYDQFRNAQSQPQFLINVQDEQQIPFNRPIRKESNLPPTENIVNPKEINAQQSNSEVKKRPSGRSQKQKAQKTTTAPSSIRTETTVQIFPSLEQSTPVSFQIPIGSPGADVTVSPAVLAKEFEQPAEPQVSRTLLPKPAEILTVPIQFWNNGFFSTDFGSIPAQAVVPLAPVVTKLPARREFGDQIPRPISRLRAFDPAPGFKNNPTGSFSRIVIKNKSGVSDYVVRY